MMVPTWCRNSNRDDDEGGPRNLALRIQRGSFACPFIQLLGTLTKNASRMNRGVLDLSREHAAIPLLLTRVYGQQMQPRDSGCG
jgi:hypothetical protein